jgi:hypothetical protein
MTWGLFIFSVEKYFRSIPFEQQLKTPSVHFVPNSTMYEFWFFLRSKIPQKAYSALAHLAFSTSMKKNAERLKKVNQKGQMVNYLMGHFT